MKKSFVVCWMLLIVFLLGTSAMAVSLQGDLSYVLGQNGASGEGKTGGFLVHAAAEVFPQVVVDGFFLSSNPSQANGEGFFEQILGGGAKYKIEVDSELDVFLGVGWTNFKIETGSDDSFQGDGIYGKLGLKYRFDPKTHLISDLNYAPKLNFGEEGGTFLSGRATVSYEVFDGLGLQGTIGRYKAGSGSSPFSSIFYGGGVTFSF